MDNRQMENGFMQALRTYKLRANGLDTLVNYRDDSFRAPGGWPLVVTTPLLAILDLAVITFCIVYRNTVFIIPTGLHDLGRYVHPIVGIGMLIFAIYNTYKFTRAILLLRYLTENRLFDDGFPPEINVK